MENLDKNKAILLAKRKLCSGTAPLASFEDLPTDEQNSTSSDEDKQSNGEKIINLKQSQASKISDRNPQITVTDHDSNETICKNYNHDFNFVQQQKEASLLYGSAQHDQKNQSLSVETIPKEKQRKSSWTDFFFGRKSPTFVKPKQQRKFSLFPFRFTFKDNQKNHHEETEMVLTDFTKSPSPTSESSMLKTNIEDHYDSSMTTSTETVVCVQDVVANIERENTLTEIPPLNSPGSPSSLTSKDDPLPPVELVDHQSIQVSLIDDQCDRFIPEERPIDCVVIQTTTADYTECSECESASFSCDCLSETDMDIVADNEDNDLDDDQQSQIQNRIQSYDSNELEMLLKNDELDLIRKHHSSSVNEVKFFENSVQETVSIKSKTAIKVPVEPIVVVVECEKKLKTTPIERPHSIIPININKFEAYLDSFVCNEMKNSEKNRDKLKITLPGEEFNNNSEYRIKSRKSNPFIWQEFCEKGLKSPQTTRKRANSCFADIIKQQQNQNFECNFYNDKKGGSDSPGNLTPVTPIQNLDISEEDMFTWKLGASSTTNDEESLILRGKAPKIATFNDSLDCSNCNCSCSNSITSILTNTLSMTNTYTGSETNFGSEVTSNNEDNDENETKNLIVPERDLRDIPGLTATTGAESAGSDLEDQPLVSPCDCVCHAIPIMNNTSNNAGNSCKEYIFGNIDEHHHHHHHHHHHCRRRRRRNSAKAFGMVSTSATANDTTTNSEEITDLCLLSPTASSTLSSSSSSTSSSSTSSTTTRTCSSSSPSATAQ